jgi:hypothetical protein
MIVALAVGAGVAVGMGVSVAEGSAAGGEAVQVGAGATVAAVLQADIMKVAARTIPVNLRNIFLVIMIHSLSKLIKEPNHFNPIIQPIRGQLVLPALLEYSNGGCLIFVHW